MHRKLFIELGRQRVRNPLKESISASLLIGINHAIGLEVSADIAATAGSQRLYQTERQSAFSGVTVSLRVDRARRSCSLDRVEGAFRNCDERDDAAYSPDRQGEMLKPIEHLKFYEQWHRYRYKDNWLARSVTQILSFDLTDEAKHWINVTKDGPDGWKVRGETVHNILENKLRGRQQQIEDRWRDWADPLLDCDVFRGAEVMATEYRLCEPTKSMGGSFDFLLYKPGGEIIIGDLKTVGSKSGFKRRKAATAQLGAYTAMMQNRHPNVVIDTCVTVVSGPGECRVISEDPAKCVETWLDKHDEYECKKKRRW